MKKELQDKLYQDYPKLFKQKDLSMRETCMCWGIETGDGWYSLLDKLCSLLQWDIDKNNYPQIEARQVKEKFGTLRFYYSYVPSEKKYDERKYGVQEGMISFAEYLSEYICETCGSTEGVKQTDGWVVTLCEKCMEKYKKRGKN